MSATASHHRGYLQRSPSPSGLYDVVDLILDKGLVIDVYVRVSLIGIEILTIDARIVIASVDTYLRFAEAVNRLDLTQQSRDLPELVEDLTSGVSRGKGQGAIQGAKEALLGGNEEQKRPARRRRASSDDEGE
jgi:gas vesicle structural protein